MSVPRVLQVFQSGGGVAANVMQLTSGLPDHGYQVEVAGPLQSDVDVALADAGGDGPPLPAPGRLRRARGATSSPCAA